MAVEEESKHESKKLSTSLSCLDSADFSSFNAVELFASQNKSLVSFDLVAALRTNLNLRSLTLRKI